MLLIHHYSRFGVPPSVWAEKSPKHKEFQDDRGLPSGGSFRVHSVVGTT